MFSFFHLCLFFSDALFFLRLGFAWCAIVLPEMVPSVPGAAVMSGNVSLGVVESWRSENVRHVCNFDAKLDMCLLHARHCPRHGKIA